MFFKQREYRFSNPLWLVCVQFSQAQARTSARRERDVSEAERERGRERERPRREDKEERPAGRKNVFKFKKRLARSAEQRQSSVLSRSSSYFPLLFQFTSLFGPSRFCSVLPLLCVVLFLPKHRTHTHSHLTHGLNTQSSVNYTKSWN